MDRRVPRHSAAGPAVVHRTAHAGSGRQDVRKVHGVRPGLYQAAVRITGTRPVQSHPDLFGRGLQLGGTLYGEFFFFVEQLHKMNWREASYQQGV